MSWQTDRQTDKDRQTDRQTDSVSCEVWTVPRETGDNIKHNSWAK